MGWRVLFSYKKIQFRIFYALVSTQLFLHATASRPCHNHYSMPATYISHLRAGMWCWALKRAQERSGNIKSREVELDPQESPEEIKRNEVELDPQESPGELKSREVELDSQERWSWTQESPGETKSRVVDLDSQEPRRDQEQGGGAGPS